MTYQSYNNCEECDYCGEIKVLQTIMRNGEDCLICNECARRLRKGNLKAINLNY